MLCIGSLIAISSACTTQQFKVYDKEVCGDLGQDGAACAHTYIDKKRDLTKKQWDEIRIGWLCSNSEGFNDTETLVEQVCQVVSCDYQTRENVKKVVAKAMKIAKRAKSARIKYMTLKKKDVDSKSVDHD